MYLCAGVDLGLLCWCVARNSVHVLGRAQCFWAGLAKLQSAEFFAWRGGPERPQYAAGGNAKQKPILGVIQNVAGTVTVQVERCISSPSAMPPWLL